MKQLEKLALKLWPLDAGQLCAEAQRRTGLVDFGEPPLASALARLINSLEREADLHPLGRFLMRTHLRDLLETRLQLIAAWKTQGDVDLSPIRQPVFITGMPRSGSTFLHELLALNPALRVPRVWEVMMPVSANKPESGWHDARVRKTAACLWWFRRLVPQADAVYPVRARTPHECVAIHSYTLLAEEFVSSCRVPGYEAFLRASDMRPVYAWQKRFLQHLQADHPARWVLKSPDHVYGLEALFAVFPDAVVVQTHRNPLEVLKSLIHLAGALHGLYARPGDRDRLVAREARILAEASDRFIHFRDAHPELADRFIDVNYPELIAEPLTVVRRICQQFDIPLTSLAVDTMRQFAFSRSRYPGRQAVPTLADAGLDVPAQARRFEGYCSRFGMPRPQISPS